MSEANRLIDGLGLFLTGGASNTNPDDSLGGVRSSARVRGLGAIVSKAIPALRIENVFPACGEGDAEIQINSDGDLVFYPPGDAVGGDPVTIAAGETKILAGADDDQAVRVSRVAGFDFSGLMQMKLVNAMNGVLGQSNVNDAARQAGSTTYRALMLHAPGLYGVIDIRLWMPPVPAAQAVYSLAVEDLVAGAIQTLADETTAPAGVAWVTPTTEGSALTIPGISPGASKGLWIRRVFPPGHVAPREAVQMAMKFRGA